MPQGFLPIANRYAYNPGNVPGFGHAPRLHECRASGEPFPYQGVSDCGGDVLHHGGGPLCFTS